MNAEMERIDAAWKQLSDLVAKLGPDGLVAKARDGWAVKDHLAHIGAWEHSLRGLVEGQDRLEAMGVHEPVEENTDVVRLSLRQWQSLLDLQARLAVYLRQIGEPND